MAGLPTVLVTGGCGFLSTAIVSALLDTNRYSITAIDINPPSLGSPNFSTNRSSSNENSKNTVNYIRCDVLDPQSLSKVFSETKPTAVIHTVGVYPLGTKRYSMKGKEAVFKVNVEGTRNVLEVSREYGVKSFVYTSSVTVVLDELDRDFRNVDETWPTGRVHTSYGQSKAIAENLVLTSNTPSLATCALRSAPIFGPNDATCIPRIHACIAGGETPFILGSGTNMQDFVYIDNVAHAHVLATDKLLASFTEGRPAAAAGEAMFITNGEPNTVRDFFLAIWKEFGHVPKFSVVVPEGLIWAMGYAAEWVEWFTGTPGTLCRGVIGDTCRDRYVSIDKARRLLGYEPKIGLEEGIKLSCQHYKTMLEGRRKT